METQIVPELRLAKKILRRECAMKGDSTQPVHVRPKQHERRHRLPGLRCGIVR